MKRFLAALALLLVGLPGVTMADAGVQESPGLVFWPRAGGFTNSLMMLPSGQPTCILGMNLLSNDPAVKLNIMIWVQQATTHLYVISSPERPPPPKEIVFYDEGKPFLRLPVMTRLVTAPDGVSEMADLPGDTMVSKLFPHFLGGQTLALGFDQAAPIGAIATDRFAEAQVYQTQCFHRARDILEPPQPDAPAGPVS